MNRISEVTRRDIVDAITLSDAHWSGRLEPIAFLNRIFDLAKLPSQDSRFKDAEGDIWQHTVNNDDWEPDWVFTDSRFNLLRGDDEVFLRFLCEALHPVVRKSVVEAEGLAAIINGLLRADGFELAEKMLMSGRPVFAARELGLTTTPALAAARQVLTGADLDHVARQISRMEAAVASDPELAIGTAKELVETCCKTILTERGAPFSRNADLPELVSLTTKELDLAPKGIPEEAKARDTIKRLLSNLATITQGVAELRNHYGTGHGKHAASKGLQSRHARLAVGAASTLAAFLAETHNERRRGNPPLDESAILRREPGRN